VRGLFDRYNPDGQADVSYAVFSQGLYGEDNPFPPPPKRSPEECVTAGKPIMRESPANNWENSSGELVPHTSPTRMLSLANEKHRTQKPAKWGVASADATTTTWKRIA
jgi:hypothetical protein